MRPPAAWRPGLCADDIRLEVPEGIERLVGRMLLREGLPDAVVERPGLIRLKNAIPLERLEALPREVYHLRLTLARCAAGLGEEAAFEALVRAASEGEGLARWVEDVGSLRYRFSVEGLKVPPEMLRKQLGMLRAWLEPLGVVDAPSAYNCEVIASWRGAEPTLDFRPRFSADERFAYRKRDVPAAINPVVAAALARLAHAPAGAPVIDPTCGSGTLLFERGFVDPAAPLSGMDIDAGAIEAAQENGLAAGVAPRLTLRVQDCRDVSAWRPCGLVLANLPFGIRSGRGDRDLAGLYQAILQNAAANLIAGGKVLLATSNRTALEMAVNAAKTLAVLARHRFASGGLHVHVVVLGLASDRR